MIGYVILHPIKKWVPYLLAIFSTDANSTFVTINAKVTLDVAGNPGNTSPNLRSGVIYFLLLCFFGSRGKKIKGEGMIAGYTSRRYYGHFFWAPGKTAIHFLV